MVAKVSLRPVALIAKGLVLEQQGSGIGDQGSGFRFRIVFSLFFYLKKLSLTCNMVHVTNFLCRIESNKNN